MRVLIIVAGAALVLSACGNNDQSDNTQNIDENLTAENIVSNDVTAIDAVTGDAANMAADVNYSNESDNGVDNLGNSSAPRKTSTKPPRSTPAPTNTTAPTASDNTAE